MNGFPMKFDYSKTINEQLPTFNYYKDRYCSYELELINDRKEIERLNNIINKAIDFLKENACIDEDVEYFCDDLRYDDCKKLLNILKGGSKE